jgi:succinyl-diaminopimelate desuccinylase
MPFLGRSAIDAMAAFLEAVRTELKPALASRRTAMPVVPDGARHATINVNAVEGGQVGGSIQTPCVADVCRAVLDRRFLIEEGLGTARADIRELLHALEQRVPDFQYAVRDLMVVEPVAAPLDSPLVAALKSAIAQTTGRDAAIVASPGTYDQKHVARIAGIEHCVAYGPGILELAHQPDEYCTVEDMVSATKVLALTLLRLNGLE